MNTRSGYYARRSAGVAVGAVVGAVFGGMTFALAIWAGSRAGEMFAGGRQVLVNNHGRVEVAK